MTRRDPLVVAGPDDALVHCRAGLDLFVLPDLRPGIDGAALADPDLVTDDSALLEEAVVFDGHVAADDRLPQPRVLADVGVGPDDRVADLCVLIDHGEVPNAHRPIEEHTCLDLRLLADVRRPHHPYAQAPLHVLAHPDVALPPLAIDLNIDPTAESVPVSLVIGLDVPDVAPVARREITKARQPVLEHLGKDVGAPVDHGRRR